MRVYLTGATGFVGSNVARVFAERHGAHLLCPINRRRPPAGAPYAAEPLAFDLDGDLLALGPRIPYDTSLDARATAAALGVELPGVASMLARLRAEIDTGRPHPLEALAA